MIRNLEVLIKEQPRLYYKLQIMDNQPQVVNAEQGNEQQKKDAPTKQLVFKEYPSIELSTRDKVVKAIRDHQYDKENILWVASQKIHGSNFSIHCSGQKIRYGRRTDFLTEDIDMQCQNVSPFFKQSFYDARNLVNTFHNKIINVHKKLKEMYPDMVKFSIYGEYFGGSYPNKESTVKAVQKGVFYVPQHEFMAFDVRIFTDKTTFWVDVTDIPKCLQDNIRSVPIYSRGTFDEMFAINTKIDSTIPQLYGFAKVNDNIIEGFVIRPNHSLKYKNNERVMLKKKNSEFEEKARAPAGNQPKVKGQKLQKVIDPEVVPFVEALEVYLNFNRIQSVISKFPDVKNRKVLKQEITKDIMSDAAKDQFKQPAGELNKKVKAQFDNRVIKMLNDYFTQH